MADSVFLDSFFIYPVGVLASTGATSTVKDDHSSSSAAEGAKSKSSSMSSSEEGITLIFI
jgi:hypothetical protein